MKELSHADYTADQIRTCLLELRYKHDYSVKQLAELADCSTSLIYAYCEDASDAKAKYVWTLAQNLVRRDDCYLLVKALLKPGDRIQRDDVAAHQANGSTDDEVAEGTVILGGITLAGRAGNADAIAEQRKAILTLEKRLAAEEALLRTQDG